MALASFKASSIAVISKETKADIGKFLQGRPIIIKPYFFFNSVALNKCLTPL